MPFELELAAHYLSGHKLRTFLTTLAIIIGVMVLFGMGILLPSIVTLFFPDFTSLFTSSG